VILCKGSVLPQLRKNRFSIGGQEYLFESETQVIPDSPQPDNIIRTAMEYLNTPYLWGGRSPFGIDCSGFTQIVFRICGIPLKRDAVLQAQHGEMISFINEALPGDLAFFENSVGNITHTGILTGSGKIIHASGRVRIDSVDHHGIYDSETDRYTHTLRVIKRIS
jgi:cell wall-associated NlpC family hydrolase